MTLITITFLFNNGKVTPSLLRQYLCHNGTTQSPSKVIHSYLLLKYVWSYNNDFESTTVVTYYSLNIRKRCRENNKLNVCLFTNTL